MRGRRGSIGPANGFPTWQEGSEGAQLREIGVSGSWPSSLGDLQRRLDELFEEVIYRRWPRSTMLPSGAGKTWTPAVDLHELTEGFLIEVDLPGVLQSDLRIELAQRAITISGQRLGVSPDGFLTSVRERPSGPFRRTLELPERIDLASVEPALQNGVLRIFVPKVAIEPAGENRRTGAAS
jgi:HSP20 family protein